MVRTLPDGRTRLVRVGVVMTLFASLLAAALMSPSRSVADDDHSDLRHRSNQLDNHIDTQVGDVDEVSVQLIRAQGRVNSAVVDLNSARDLLGGLREQVEQAEILDRQLQDRLDQAVVRLRNARRDLRQGRQDSVDQRGQLAGFAVSNYQTGGVDALSLGLGFDAQTVREAVDGVQDSDSMLNKQTVVLQQLQAGELLLELTEQRVEATKGDVKVRRQEAADSLATKRDLEREAATAKRDVAARVSSLRLDRQRAAVAKAQELRRLDRLENERDRVENRLQQIAERRERKRQRAIEQAQRAERQRERAAQQRARAAGPPGRPATTTAPAPLAPPPSTVSPAPATPAKSVGPLIYPVNNTYITSPYGMRMHPILHVYKLHDGTDFHADCGTPVYASAAGRISEEYFNVGYGNRIILDHGYVNGVSLWTSYNHLTSFVAGVGQQVQQGQLIGYAGTTGYSTGCHLHFMVYVNGTAVDPENWL